MQLPKISINTGDSDRIIARKLAKISITSEDNKLSDDTLTNHPRSNRNNNNNKIAISNIEIAKRDSRTSSPVSQSGGSDIDTTTEFNNYSNTTTHSNSQSPIIQSSAAKSHILGLNIQVHTESQSSEISKQHNNNNNNNNNNLMFKINTKDISPNNVNNNNKGGMRINTTASKQQESETEIVYDESTVNEHEQDIQEEEQEDDDEEEEELHDGLNNMISPIKPSKPKFSLNLQINTDVNKPPIRIKSASDEEEQHHRRHNVRNTAKTPGGDDDMRLDPKTPAIDDEDIDDDDDDDDDDDEPTLKKMKINPSCKSVTQTPQSTSRQSDTMELSSTMVNEKSSLLGSMGGSLDVDNLIQR